MDRACFWFYYPKARGCGLVIDSRALRRDGNRGNRAQVFRLDWHRCLPLRVIRDGPLLAFTQPAACADLPTTRHPPPTTLR